MGEQHSRLTCRTCGKELGRRPSENRFFPFCGERCKLIDLGKWFNGEHRIVDPPSDQPAESEVDEDASGEAGGQ